MNNLAELPIAPAAAVSFMGPARVISTQNSIVVRRSDGLETPVEMALSFPYEPVEDDLLLLIGGATGHYAVGVIDGRGTSKLAMPGDIDVHAQGGRLNLKADQGVHIQSPEVEMVTDKLRVVADRMMQKVEHLYQHSRGLWSMKAKSMHVAVEEDMYQRSKSATILTEEVVTINGKQIHLG